VTMEKNFLLLVLLVIEFKNTQFHLNKE